MTTQSLDNDAVLRYLKKRLQDLEEELANTPKTHINEFYIDRLEGAYYELEDLLDYFGQLEDT